MTATLCRAAVLSSALAMALLVVAPRFAGAQDGDAQQGSAQGEQKLAEQQADAYFQRLLEALREDPSYKVRLQAAVFLGRSNDERSFEPLIAALTSDEHYAVRAAAATALANLGNPRAISYIIKRIASESEAFAREEAERALAKFEREQALQYVIATYSSEDPAVRRQAVAFLAAGLEPATYDVLIRALGDTDEIRGIVEEAVRSLPAEDGLAFLKDALDHREASVRQGAVQVLRSIGNRDAADLILAVYERDIEADGVRRETRDALRKLRSHLDIEEVIRNAKEHPQRHTRAKALKLLGVIGGERAEQVLLEALHDQDVYLRGTAVMAMAELGDPSVVPSLEKLESDPANQRILHLVRHTLKRLRNPQSVEN